MNKDPFDLEGCAKIISTHVKLSGRQGDGDEENVPVAAWTKTEKLAVEQVRDMRTRPIITLKLH